MNDIVGIIVTYDVYDKLTMQVTSHEKLIEVEHTTSLKDAFCKAYDLIFDELFYYIDLLDVAFEIVKMEVVYET